MATKGLAFWSETADTNATADSSVNWAEGQAPSSINNSARAMMGSMARYRNDISGNITTAGTSTAYTATTSQDFATLAQMNAQIITIVPHATNGAAPTLAVNGLSAKQIRTETGVSVASGVMVAGTPYQLVYFSSAGEFILMNFAINPYSVPIGGFLPYMSSTPPNSNFVFPYGQAISRTAYSVLFNLPDVGTTHGVGNGVDTFNLPDLRDRSIAFWGSMGGSAASRLTNQTGGVEGDTIGATGGSETQTLLTAHMPVTTPAGTISVVDTHVHDTTVNGYNNDADIGHLAGGSGSIATSETFRSGTTIGGSITAAFTGTPFGSGSAHNNVQPTIILPCILRII